MCVSHLGSVTAVCGKCFISRGQRGAQDPPCHIKAAEEEHVVPSSQLGLFLLVAAVTTVWIGIWGAGTKVAHHKMPTKFIRIERKREKERVSPRKS